MKIHFGIQEHQIFLMYRKISKHLHHYFNLHVCLPLHCTCVSISHTSLFYCVHSFRCLITSLLQLGYPGKALFLSWLTRRNSSRFCQKILEIFFWNKSSKQILSRDAWCKLQIKIKVIFHWLMRLVLRFALKKLENFNFWTIIV